jgi:hypothetical protein
MFDLQTIAKINAEAERRERLARAAFVNPGFACKWARNNAHGPFTAFVPENPLSPRVVFVAIVVSPRADGTWQHSPACVPKAA